MRNIITAQPLIDNPEHSAYIQVMIHRFALLCALPFLLFSCKKENPNITIYSDSPETAVMVDLFNQTQDAFHARFIYAGSDREEGSGAGSSDIIISRDIHSSVYKKRMTNLDGYRTTPFVSSIYPTILRSGVENSELKTIPLSLELPAVIAAPGVGEGNKFISWDEMTRVSSEFNELQNDFLTGCGFSPLWSGSFLKAWFNTNVSLDGNIDSEADFYQVIESSDALVDWIQEINGGSDLDTAFSDKYRYIPDYRLIMEGRSGFTVIPLSEWALLPDTISRELDMRLLNPGNGLVALSILSVGLPESSENSEGAAAFLEWLLRESTWDDYLKLNSRYRDESFTFLGGFSASEDLNVKLLPQYFPAAASVVPRKGEFAEQPGIPPQWSKLWEDLFLPLYRERVKGTPHGFSEEYKKWLLQNPDPWEEEE